MMHPVKAHLRNLAERNKDALFRGEIDFLIYFMGIVYGSTFDLTIIS